MIVIIFQSVHSVSPENNKIAVPGRGLAQSSVGRILATNLTAIHQNAVAGMFTIAAMPGS
ncbi:MAG: hypothetical protein K8L91_07815 [Anaerolineae bacterium]|nr:hypothetical protein [Anaerolineae bacterium]